MECHSEVGHRARPQNEITENSGASCSRPRTKLRDFLLSDKPALSYADFHHEVTGFEGLGISKSSGRQQNHGTQGRARNDGMIKHISRLPEEKGGKFQEKFSTVSSSDWRQFEKLYKHSPMPYKNSGISPSTSSSSYFSTDGSSSTSSRGNSSSPGPQRSHLSPSQSRVETSLVKNYIRDECFSARGKSPARQVTYHLVPQSNHPKQYPLQGRPDDVNHLRRIVASTPIHMTKQQKICVVDQNCSTNRSGIRPDTLERKISDSNTTSEMGKQHKDGNLDSASAWEGKMRSQESEGKEEIVQLHEPNVGHCDPACMKEHRAFMRDPSQYSRSSHFSDSSAFNYHIPGEKMLKSPLKKGNVMQLHCSNSDSHVPHSCPLPSTDSGTGNRQSELRGSCSMTTTQGVQISAQLSKSPLRNRNIVDTKVSPGLKSASAAKFPRVLDRRSGPESTSKVRQPSPIRRLSSAVGSFIRSAGSRENSPLRRSNSPLRRSNPKDPVAKTERDESYTEKSQANTRARSSPIRRLLDPLLKSKAPHVRDVAHISKIDSSTSGHCKSSDEQLQVAKSTFDSGRANTVKASHQNMKQGSTSLQALLQVSVKNGLPLFTFAVDNDSDILAATLKKSSAPERSCPSWIYTFFTIHEMKKKNGSWLNHGSKGNSHGYVPNVLAQMKASNPQFPVDIKQKAIDAVNLREFTLFSVDTRQVDQHATEFQPTTELAAIVAKILKPSSNNSINPSDMSSRECPVETSIDFDNTLQERHSIRSQSLLSTTVILPGDVHTIPIKGPVSTLTQRWRSGGSCDCGGWDVGCQLRIFNQDDCKKSVNSVKTAVSSDEFKLFSQVGQEIQAVLSLKPYKDRIYSVELESSFSLLQAFATSVAVLDCTRFISDNNNVVEGRASTSVGNLDDPFLMKVTTEGQGEAFTGHISYPPPHSPVGRV
ncbi:hypothetical protein V2J09_019096 [Rumex salicifolius]